MRKVENQMESGKKAVVLLSGGIDSTTCLALAVDELGTKNVLALNMLYGQKQALRRPLL